MSGEKNYFYDELQGTGLMVRTHLDSEGDLFISVHHELDMDFDSLLLRKEDAAALAEVLLSYARS